MSSTLAKKLLDEFATIFKDISVKTFFKGFNIYSGETIFGYIEQSAFYLRGHSDYRDLFMELNMPPLILPAGVTTKSLDYYQVGEVLFNDRRRLYDIIAMVIECARHDKQQRKRAKEHRIKELPNMTLSLERLLFSVGIVDIETFNKVGYLEAFYRMKQKRNAISINVLFILYCALHQIHIGRLSPSTKKEIEFMYQRFLG